MMKTKLNKFIFEELRTSYDVDIPKCDLKKKHFKSQHLINVHFTIFIPYLYAFLTFRIRSPIYLPKTSIFT